MNDIIVVFGSVKSSTYRHLSLAMMRAGLKPKIVRVDQKHEYEGQGSMPSFYYHLAQNRESDENSPRFARILEEESEKFMNSVFSEALPSAEHIEAVKAVILPYSELGLDYRWMWFTSQLGDYAEYTVQKSEADGSFWLSGSGFGDSLPDIYVD